MKRWVPWAYPWHEYGLEFGAQPKHVDGGASLLLKLATLMAQVHVGLAHLAAPILKKEKRKISYPLVSIIC